MLYLYLSGLSLRKIAERLRENKIIYTTKSYISIFLTIINENNN